MAELDCFMDIQKAVGRDGWQTFLRALSKQLHGPEITMELIRLRADIKDVLNDLERNKES